MRKRKRERVYAPARARVCVDVCMCVIFERIIKYKIIQKFYGIESYTRTREN